MHFDRHEFSVRTNDGGTSHVVLDYFPDECPVCHSIGEIKRDFAQGYKCPSTGPSAGKYVQIIYRCPRTTCGSHFIIEYEAPRAMQGDGFQNHYFRKRTFPNFPKRRDVSDRIAKLSPNFVQVANQAHAAEAHGLEEICGMGYRKALEYLIKDYCIHKEPDLADKIRTKMLMPCINDHVADANIKECARRATWLGNDETHYERRWTELDVEDLKMLIRLTQNWIDNELLTAHYIEAMNTRTPQSTEG
jgi:Domain of unknown function (DUF4145)